MNVDKMILWVGREEEKKTMNRKFIRSLILGCLLGLYAGIAEAQQASPPPPHAAGMIQGGPEGDFPPPPFGERMELLGFGGMHGGKVVTGTPFSAVVVSQTTQTLADGNHITRKTQTNIFRDSQGRIRKEITLSGFGPIATSEQPKSFVVINDPVAGTTLVLHPDLKTAEKVGKPFADMKGAARRAMNDKMELRQEEITGVNLTREDLGTQTIEGITAQGTRVTKTIPAGQIGNEKPITIVREVWYSSELQMTVMSKRRDPWSGETTYSLTNIQRTEPDPALFAVPSDYTVTQRRPGAGRRMGRRPEQPPADN